MEKKHEQPDHSQPFWIYWGLAMALLASLMLFGFPNVDFNSTLEARAGAQLSAAH